MVMYVLLLVLLIPFIGTVIGACFVFLINRKISDLFNLFFLGFSGGVMFAASIWSLIIPGLESNIVLLVVGFIIGLFVLMFFKTDNDLLNLAVVIHNIPEGFVVGVFLALVISGSAILSEAFVLSMGIGIQNIPEGSVISFNYYPKYSKFKAFNYGVLSGVVEVIAGIIGVILVWFISPLLALFLGFAAGCMIYVVVVEIIPRCCYRLGYFGFSFGFIVMMLLDVIIR